MGWLERLPKRAVSARPTAPASTIFVGVSDRPDRGVSSRGAGLLEFWTTDGKHVDLYDTDLKSFTYRPTPSPTLDMTFGWDDNASAPAGHVGPLVELRFQEVQVLRWDEDAIESDAEREYLGQVSGFEYTDGVFTLSTLNINLMFSARRCVVTTHD